MKTTVANIIKIILVSIAATAVLAYLLYTVSIPTTEPAICNQIQIDILDRDLFTFVNENDVKEKLAEQHINPIGKKASHNLADSVEKIINSISFVEKSECYIGDNGVMVIELTQRRPVLLVKSGASEYYIDSERKRIPVSPHHTAMLMLVTGKVKEKSAKNEIFDLAAFLGNDEFYKNHIDQIHVDDEGLLFLGTKKGVPVIKMGKLNDYRTKLGKLRAWYEQYPGFAWGDKYKMVDVSYQDLIYCTLAK